MIERSWLACPSKLKSELGYSFTEINTAEDNKRREGFWNERTKLHNETKYKVAVNTFMVRSRKPRSRTPAQPSAESSEGQASSGYEGANPFIHKPKQGLEMPIKESSSSAL